MKQIRLIIIDKQMDIPVDFGSVSLPTVGRFHLTFKNQL